MKERRKSVLTIAGSDSSAGAGIQQDLKTINSFHLHAATVITSVTAQNTRGVQDFQVLPLDLIGKQIDSVFEDLKIEAVKTGMLATSEVISLVREKLSESDRPVVVDPVMVATSGDLLLDEKAVSEMKKLVSEADLSTPNVYEAEILTDQEINNKEDLLLAGEKLGTCLIKGGHLPKLEAIDFLFLDNQVYKIESKIGYRKIQLHGSGCAYSSAIAAYLALDNDLKDSVENAKRFMDAAIEKHFPVGKGSQLLDAGRIRYSVSSEREDENEILEKLECSLAKFLSHPHACKLIPEVGTNIAYAKKNAFSVKEVAGLTGRIVKTQENVVPAGVFRFGGSSHMARALTEVMKHDPDKRAIMNIRYSEEILSACQKLDYSIASFDRRNEPDEGNTMEWAFSRVLSEYERIPGVVYDTGSRGKEPMVRLLGSSPEEVIEDALEIAALLNH